MTAPVTKRKYTRHKAVKTIRPPSPLEERGNYTPWALHKELCTLFETVLDGQVAFELGIDHAQYSRILAHIGRVQAPLILRVHEVTGWGVAYIRDLLGDKSEEPFKPPIGKPKEWRWEE